MKYRFYSRKQGLLSDEVENYKYYTSSIIEINKNIGDKLIGLSGKEIMEIYPKIKESMKYEGWYFYDIDINIGCGSFYYN